MRYLYIAVAAVAAVLPAVSQQPDTATENQGIVNQRAIGDAVRNALRKSLNVPGVLPAGARPPRSMTLPKRQFLQAPLPVCSVPLLAVPTPKDADNRIFRGRLASADREMIVPPAAPACSDR